MQLPADTARLRFAPLTEADAPFILTLVNEPGWLQHIGDRQVHDLEAAAGYARKGPQASYATHGYGLYRVSLKASGEPIGLAGLVRRDTLPGPDLGYAVLAKHYGQGYTTEAAAAVLAFASERLGLRELLAITSLDNAASIRVLQKLGFVEDGTMHDAKTGLQSRRFLWQAH